MRIFVISLRSAVARRAEAARQLSARSLDFEFFDAVERVADAFQYFERFDRRLFRLNTGRVPMPGEIGCFASHKALWQACVACNEPIIILEDDFTLADNFSAALADIEVFVNRFGFVRLQHYRRARRLFRLGQWHCNYRLPGKHAGRLRYLSHVPLCLLAYGISPAAAAALIEGSKTLCAPVDKYVQRTWAHATPIFALENPVVALADTALPSTIGNRTDKDRGIAMLLGRLFYKGFGELQRVFFNRKQLIKLGINGPHAPEPRPLHGLGSQHQGGRW